MTDVKRIESYSLYEFCQQVEESIKEGYSFDFDSNENFPQNYGTLLTCGLVKASGKKITKISDNPELQLAVVDGLADGSLVPEGSEADTQTDEVTENVSSNEQTEESVQNDIQETQTTDEVNEVETEEPTEVETPAKRGPKPKVK